MMSWQKITSNDLDELRKHYLLYDPYCHLNIVDMWSYRGGPNYWFRVGDTVIYRLNDYMDNSLYITILGDKSAKYAIRELSLKNKSKQSLVLKRVPEVTVEALKGWGAIKRIEEDLDNHDYIFDVQSLVEFSSPSLKRKHPTYTKLVNRFPTITIRRLHIEKQSERQLMYRVFRRWIDQTQSDDWHKEFLALKRAVKLKGVGLICLGFFYGQKMIGYTVNEPEREGYYYQAFFGKADRHFPGLGLLMEHETAKYFNEHFHSKFMNLQPDSGISGLRYYKTSLGPHRFLKKYIVEIDTAKAIAEY